MSRLHCEDLASLLQKRVLADEEEVTLVGVKMKGDQTFQLFNRKFDKYYLNSPVKSQVFGSLYTEKKHSRDYNLGRQ